MTTVTSSLTALRLLLSALLDGSLDTEVRRALAEARAVRTKVAQQRAPIISRRAA